MARILTGIQSTGTPHLGNVLGAIRPAIQLAQDTTDESFLFIADLSLTQIKDGADSGPTPTRWPPLGWPADSIPTAPFFTARVMCRSAPNSWYLSCFFPYSRLTLAHSFKDKADRLEDVNAGLFSYPMLMAADILPTMPMRSRLAKTSCSTSRWPGRRRPHQPQGGQRGRQPEARTNNATVYVPGTDGAKMSKSMGNTLDPFADEKSLKKAINKQIVTDATPLEDPKDPEGSVVYQLYKLLVSESDAADMAAKLRAGLRLGPRQGPPRRPGRRVCHRAGHVQPVHGRPARPRCRAGKRR